MSGTRTKGGDGVALRDRRFVQDFRNRNGRLLHAAWFDLPGVPWSTFFTCEGIAIHGTYWHNDFGLPRSHGCVNVPISVAKWIYFWTDPIPAYEDDFMQGNVKEAKVTQIIVT
jgi:hypothetical protein